MLTTIILIKNNEKTIKRALNSVKSPILVGDLGSTDGTPGLCRRHGAEVIKLDFNGDYSQVKNTLVQKAKTDWLLNIEAWEFLKGSIQFPIEVPKCFRLPCIQGDLLLKQVRIWHKSLSPGFVNPVYETLSYNSSEELNIPIISPPIDRTKEAFSIIERWKKVSPLAIEPYYYEAFTLLASGNIKEFIKIAKYYLFNEKSSSMATTLIRYYLAVYEQDAKESLRNLLYCLAKRPLMAEFWCLLGDIYYKQKYYDKAKIFYKNAQFLGSRRLKDDEWPMEISKYRLYPQKMIEACDKIIKNSLLITVAREQLQ